MVEKVKRVTKVRKTRRLGIGRRVTMKGLYYREMINRIFNNKKKIRESDAQEKRPFKEYLKEENYIIDKRG